MYLPRDNPEVDELTRLRIPALACTSETLTEARKSGRNLTAEIVDCCWSIVCVDPEHLTDKQWEHITNSQLFRDNIAFACVDEGHLIPEWGGEFRPAFLHIGTFLRGRLPSQVAHVYEKATNARRRYSRFGGPEFVDTPRPEIVVIDADAPLVLPFPPTDDEKYLYAQTRRVPLYIFGTLSFLSNAVGFRQAVPRTTDTPARTTTSKLTKTPARNMRLILVMTPRSILPGIAVFTPDFIEKWTFEEDKDDSPFLTSILTTASQTERAKKYNKLKNPDKAQFGLFCGPPVALEQRGASGLAKVTSGTFGVLYVSKTWTAAVQDRSPSSFAWPAVTDDGEKSHPSEHSVSEFGRESSFRQYFLTTSRGPARFAQGRWKAYGEATKTITIAGVAVISVKMVPALTAMSRTPSGMQTDRVRDLQISWFLCPVNEPPEYEQAGIDEKRESKTKYSNNTQYGKK
ncbi:hypothetical protein B0H14DRAFT_2626148 [Mycena olivaceomarginata]|nr:hypothetical protein B0H14DRAFT_2626148 [Mycena olivaceomarginata]